MAIITISRGSMSGGEALAKSLGERLGYPVLAREVIVAAAEKLGVSEETLAQKLTRSPGLWERMTTTRRWYLVAVQAALAEQASAGDLVYHGHAGHLLLTGLPMVLRVRLIAPLEMRLKAVMERQSLSRHAAVAYIEQVDEDRSRWTRLIYNADLRDPALYDLVINLEKLSLPTASEIIVSTLARPEFAATEAAKAALGDFRVACRVRMALVTNTMTRDLPVEVSVHAGVVILDDVPGGLAFAPTAKRDASEILRTARAVEGVLEVRIQRSA